MGSVGQSGANPHSSQLAHQAASIANTGFSGPLSPQGTGNQKGPMQSSAGGSSGYKYSNMPSITSNPMGQSGRGNTKGPANTAGNLSSAQISQNNDYLAKGQAARLQEDPNWRPRNLPNQGWDGTYQKNRSALLPSGSLGQLPTGGIFKI